MTLHSTCFLKMAYYESAMFKKVSKHWRNNQMQYWLLKSEPDVWSIDQEKKQGPKERHGMELEIIKQLKI